MFGNETPLSTSPNSRPPEQMMFLTLSSSRVTRALWATAVGIALLGAVAEMTGSFAGEGHLLARTVRELRRFFRPSAEGTVGTWFTVALLLLCAGLLLVIATAAQARGGHDAGRWRALAVIFAFLSCDEAIGFHERVGDWAQEIATGEGYLLWEWVIPYAALALIVAAASVPFLRRLPAATRDRFIAAGVINVGAALGLELIQARIISEFGTGTTVVEILATLEAFLEMAGAILFARALMIYLVEGTRVAFAFTRDTIEAATLAVPWIDDFPRSDAPRASETRTRDRNTGDPSEAAVSTPG